MFKIQAMHVAEGQFFDEEDEEAKARVAIIGSETKTKLFSGRLPWASSSASTASASR